MSELDSTPAPSSGSAFDRPEGLDAPNAPESARSGHATDELGPSTRRTSNPTAIPTRTGPPLTRRGRVRKWDRPKPPKDWRWWVGNLGKTLIATGLLMFGFVAYQLWGTGIETARAQNKLESQFDELIATAPAVETPDFEASTVPTIVVVDDSGDPLLDTDGQPVTAPDPSGVPVTDNDPVVAAPPPVPVANQNIPDAIQNGQALARLEIPRIGRNDIVVAGVDTGDLKRGPGHFPDTPLPGQLGNAAIAGHRTTYGGPFYDVDDLEVGDKIIATTLSGRFTYKVTGQQIVGANDYWVVATTDPTKATLTLTSCHPKYTAQQRIVIFSELVASESAPVGEPVINYGRPDEPVESTEAAAEPTLPDDGVEADTNAPTDIEQLDPTQLDGSTPQAEPTVRDGSVTGNLGDELDAGRTGPAGSDAAVLGTDDVNADIADAFSGGWFSDPSANGQVGLWGMALALVAIGAYLISRKLRRDWAGALIGIVPFVVVAYFFFQNVNRLLPPNL